jgi:GT2 family glycosyltransferase/Flp pilus assembly protein TadD/glycosyltransferase involved in cell wall biosynthesis
MDDTAGVGALPDASPDASHELQLGQLLQQHGQFDAALALYDSAIAALPFHAPEQAALHLLRAQCLQALHQDQRAADSLAEGLERHPNDPRLLDGLIGWEWRQGRLARAIELAHRQVLATPDQVPAWHLLGVLQQQAGDLQGADTSFAEVQHRDLGCTDALLRRAQIQAHWQRPIEAEWLLMQVLARQPDWPPALELMARVQLDLGRIETARHQLLQRLRAAPGHLACWLMLAQVHARRDRRTLSRRALARAQKIDPDNVETWRLLGWIAHEQGDRDSAQHAVRQLLRHLPEDNASHVQAAFVFAAAGDLAVAARHAQAAVAGGPGDASAWRALAQVRYQQERLEEALAAIEAALQLAPGHVHSLRQMGWILMASHRFGAARLAFLHACEQAPGDAVARRELAEACLRGGAFADGLQARHALEALQPGDAGARLLEARLLTEGASGAPDAQARAVTLCRELISNHQRIGEAVPVLVRLLALGAPGAREALSLLPHRSEYQHALRHALGLGMGSHGHDSLLRLASAAARDFPEDDWLATAGMYLMALSEHSSAEALAFTARDWYRALRLRAGQPSRPGPTLPRRTGARVRIAYVAGQPHDRLLRRVLASHDPSRVEVFLFSARPLSGLPAHVHQDTLDADTLWQACRVNRIDALIDAGGLHPFDGQFTVLQAFARRLAPLQLGWLGCLGTAGGLFDALLTDEVAVPAEHEHHHAEALWRLDGGQWCWDPPPHAPALQPPPVLRLHSITFGVLARGLRHNRASVQAWARTVAATPGSRIRFLGHTVSDWPQREWILSVMAEHGVRDTRVDFDQPRPYDELLLWLQRIDVVLDSFPGNGGLSLLDPLWMGVPVVTQSGDWAGARQGHSILQALGLQAWVSDTPQGFVDTAVALARDTAALARHRAGLRQRLLDSPLTDGRRLAHQIETACLNALGHVSPAPGIPGHGLLAELGADPKQAQRALARRALQAWLDKPAARIHLPEPEPGTEPDLSVVLVLHNQAGLTHRALQALADQRGVAFETLIVDNGSSDETADLLARVRGARTLTNAHNAGFLLAANQGAALARGRHLVFLNNDAVVQRGALVAACQRLDAEPAIGVLGGRIVLGDGRLQELGNAIFRDGTTLGVGRGEDPFSPAARASRPTDYVSGAFLAVRATLWRLLGGFDEHFAPAYYEDADLCLRAWRAGFRVEAEPEVLVEHLESGSATGDEVTQQVLASRARFVARHADWLRTQPRHTPQPLDGDRWRSPADSPRMPRVLIIDDEAPLMVKGAGLPRARLMLQALRDWPVSLYPLWRIEEDWRELRAALPPGVEFVLGPDQGLAGLERFLERRRGVYDVLFVSRPPNLRALQPLRARRPDLFAGMRLVYDAEALFTLREVAKAGVMRRLLGRAAAQARLVQELDLARGASDVLAVSERDAALFRAAGHRVTLISHGIAARRNAPGPAGRSGLLFVGVLHPDTPNEDGLIWFIEHVMPRLRALLPQPPVLSVVGINRSNRLTALASEQVRLLGPRDALEPLYDQARVFVAPARYAGGVPAKVIEAAAHGIPVVASALLARQLGWREGIDIQSARDADAFARGIARLLRDDGLWWRQQQAAWQQCLQRYEPGRFGQTLRHVLVAPPQERA